MLWETHVRQQDRRFGLRIARLRAMRNGVLLAVVAAALAACGNLTEETSQDSLTATLSLVADGDTVNAEELDGSIVTGIVRIIVEVNGKGVTEVRFHLNGDATPLTVDVDVPFGLHLDTTALPDGAHLIVALAPVGRGGSMREIARADFVVANGDGLDGPDASAPEPDPEPGDDPDPGAERDPDPDPIVGVRIGVGADPLAVVAAHAAGSVFVFEAGVHRLSGPIVARDGDSFVGEVGAVLSGARVLSGFVREGGLWVVGSQWQRGWLHGTCAEGVPRCRYPEDVFVDDVPLRHVGSVGEVVPGAWFFDYDGGRIYIADDPSGRVVEASVASGAIVGDADDVTVRGLIVEKFANQAQRGAIMATQYAVSRTHGERWLIAENTVRLNHGPGITAGYGARVVDNRVVMNGQLGIGGGWGPGTLVEGNEIAFNNWAGFDWGWEGGGTKFTGSDGLVVRHNHVHHNEGPGLWTDIGNLDSLIEYNVVEDNANVGVFHEISYRATIRHNSVLRNGVRAGVERYAYVFGAGILVHSSPDVTIYGNVVEGNWNGIVGLQGDRGSGGFGLYELRNLHVHDNVVSMAYHADGVGPTGGRGVAALSGVVQGGGFDEVFDVASNNRFERNQYVLPGESERHFTWMNSTSDFVTWQGFDHDVDGSVGVLSVSLVAAR